MEFKREILYITILLIFLVLNIKYYKYGGLAVSMAFILYSLKNKSFIFFTFGLLGLFLTSLIFNKEHFQGATTPGVTTPVATTPTIICNSGDSVILFKKDLNELIFIFNSLLNKNKQKTKEYIREYCIKDIFVLANVIASYSELDDSEIETNDWRYNIKMRQFAKIVFVYNLQVSEIVKLINGDNKKMALKTQDDILNKLKKKMYLPETLLNLSIQYYLGQKIFKKKHYKIVETLKLNELVTLSNFKNDLVKQLYYDYKIKDIVGIMIFFEHLNYLTQEDLNSEFATDDTNGDQWVSDFFLKINLKDIFFKEELFKQYKIKNKIETYITENELKRKEEIMSKTIDFSKQGLLAFDSELNDKFELNSEIKKKEIDEYHKVLIESHTGEKNITDLEFNNIDDIKNKIGSTYITIIDEIAELYNTISNKKCSLNVVNNMVTKYLLFFKGLMNILVKKQRLLYVGLFIIILSVIVSFIEISTY
jgi:hypothetical protein